MFESDDYDQILSQFELPEVSSHTEDKTVIESTKNVRKPQSNTFNASTIESENKIDLIKDVEDISCKQTESSSRKSDSEVSPKHTKRKIIDSYFDHKSKRKFPGPAGLLNGSFRENKDESVGQMELLSQDVDFSQNCMQKDAFDSPLWKRLLEDVRGWNVGVVDTIKGIKQQAITGNLRRRKADTVAAFIEAVDRSITDPLITIRDCTGNIKCTLHRDAWFKFSPYMVSEYCALVLWKPTVLTTGSAFKKHYLNITLSNILAIYSSAVIKDENREFPDGYAVVYEEDFTVIKLEKPISNADNSIVDSSNQDANELFDGLDSIFSDDIF
ncbi:uncharacterized protein LOC114357388 [Ostrinia furnacalis]|uniref:uncharacterized protein LOC114357388 n=1 Tax=Ostrinia furnacalis TaxID=93504 RepID=UPI00103D646B|nr:uncharacterized protein LOC114357388 [Ostrinia furnacalis]